MLDWFRQTLYVGFVLFVIGAVWVLGWAKAVDDRAQSHWAPAEPLDPARSVPASRGSMTFSPAAELPPERVTSARDPDDL